MSASYHETQNYSEDQDKTDSKNAVCGQASGHSCSGSESEEEKRAGGPATDDMVKGTHAGTHAPAGNSTVSGLDLDDLPTMGGNFEFHGMMRGLMRQTAAHLNSDHFDYSSVDSDDSETRRSRATFAYGVSAIRSSPLRRRGPVLYGPLPPPTRFLPRQRSRTAAAVQG